MYTEAYCQHQMNVATVLFLLFTLVCSIDHPLQARVLNKLEFCARHKCAETEIKNVSLATTRIIGDQLAALRLDDVDSLMTTLKLQKDIGGEWDRFISSAQQSVAVLTGKVETVRTN